MSIESEITRINNAKEAIKTSIINKGVPVADDAKLDSFPALIDSIETGGGSSSYYEELFNARTSNSTTMSNLFQNSNAKLLDISKLDTSKVYTMYYMFASCGFLEQLDLSNFDTSNVTNMNAMFYQCMKLTSLDLSNFDTSNVTNMNAMFHVCSNLQELNLSDWNTSNVTNMSSMFENCPKLTTLGDISNWNTSKVTTMSNMFYGCKSLTSLDLSNWNTSKVTSMINMFRDCNLLESVNISNFDTTNASSSSMFNNCTSLHTLRLDNCSNNTINMIITSYNFPTGAIEGVTRTIYCKESEATGLTAPTNWVFSYV